MYLKSIEVHGFKSFANKMNFEFHDGITAIVGPNGSGKSNVADAVRWVLGEQSANKLRGSRMEDVIFSGTELRKPQSFAYVAITLNNSDHKISSDYEEITVARRVYRSGESEYLINGTNCRLRDVHELFLDTGIGKEGYSIIGQGQIEKILSGKPEERRELFDEAAGIVKYKKRKAAAEKNLEEEHQNLERIHDILHEIEKQIGPLEKQSETAKKYLGYRDQLKQCDIQMFLMEYDRMDGELEELDKKIVMAQENLAEAKEKYDATKEEYEELENILGDKNRTLEEKNMALHDNRLQKEKLEGDIKVFHEQILAGKQNWQHFKDRAASIAKSAEEKRTAILEEESRKEEDGRQLLSVKAECERIEKALLSLHENLEAAAREKEGYEKEIRRSFKDDTQMKTAIQRCETMLEQNRIKKAEINQRLLRIKSEDAALEEEMAQEEKNQKAAFEKISARKEKIAGQERELAALLAKLDNLEKEREAYAASYHREQSRLESLHNLTERYEGYGQSIRRVMEQKKETGGIIGVVADILKVNKKYETAVETALGGSIQNIVTEDEETAKALIRFLKKHRYGRATFLPLTVIHPRGGQPDRQVLKEPGIIGTADILVEADPKFSGLTSYLLGRTIVADTMDSAVFVSGKYHQSLRIVTLEGELIMPGGSMSGGAFKNTSSLLGRRREMEELTQVIANLEKNQKDVEEERRRLIQEREEKAQVIEKDRKEQQALFLEQNTAQLKLEQAKEAREHQQYSLNDIARAGQKLEQEERDWQEKLRQLHGSAEDQESKKKEKEERMAVLEQQARECREKEQQYQATLGEIRLTLSSKEQNIRFMQQNIQRLAGEIEALDQEQREILEKEAQSKAFVREKEEETSQVNERSADLEERHRKLSEEIAETKKEKEKIEKSHKEFFHRREELAEQSNQLDKECFRLENQKEKLTEQKDARSNYMWEEYELTWNKARAMLPTETKGPGRTFPQLKKETAELKDKIRELGDVNVNAIEDYKNMEERYRLLKTQHDDLVESEETLREIIKELDEEMRLQFAAKFEEIRIQFDHVFKELFGGGKGAITLVEGEDILEAGIRIIAQPPGKKLQNMMQLSGGEKSLTAISLLFAIQNLKPSPFCLLDEIEAALDDSNVSRFAKYLHKLTDHTQFIVITHRRGTMAAADILYGITMQEKGVSTLVSVSLLEEELA